MAQGAVGSCRQILSVRTVRKASVSGKPLEWLVPQDGPLQRLQMGAFLMANRLYSGCVVVRLSHLKQHDYNTGTLLSCQVTPAR